MFRYVTIAWFLGLGLFAAIIPKFQLTIDNIMRGPNLVGTAPSQVRWSGDGSRIYFEWKKAAMGSAAFFHSK